MCGMSQQCYQVSVVITEGKWGNSPQNWEARPGCEGKPPPPGLTLQPSGQLVLRKRAYLNCSWLDNAGSWALVKGAADNFRKSTGEAIQILTLPSRFLIKHGNTELLRNTKTYLHSSWCSGQFAPQCHYFHSYCHSTLKEKGKGTMLQSVTRVESIGHSLFEPRPHWTVQKLSRSPRLPAFSPDGLRQSSQRLPASTGREEHRGGPSGSSQVQTPTHFPRQPLHALISVHITIISLSALCWTLRGNGKKLIERKKIILGLF